MEGELSKLLKLRSLRTTVKKEGLDSKKIKLLISNFETVLTETIEEEEEQRQAQEERNIVIAQAVEMLKEKGVTAKELVDALSEKQTKQRKTRPKAAQNEHQPPQAMTSSLHTNQSEHSSTPA
ncbi:hypothetical protein L1D14_04255 [Vibrio tubiashii]|uniref:H-NS family histone-like protein n=1 Tax=Vibrio tubiashii TaxID=29498 RepID=UPI001EFDCF1F|nr:hypothetical protein [Vibrio tubiashii]MCG9575444.1 hypothetical protein [Vibrio tubiashii]